MNRFYLSCLAVCLLACPADAGDMSVLLQDGDGTPVYARPLTSDEAGNFTYTTDLAERIDGLIPDYEVATNAIKIEFQNTTSWAISDEGPWFVLTGIESDSEWTEIPLQTLKDKSIGTYIAYKNPEIILDAALKDKARNALKIHSPEDQARWGSLLEKCATSEESSPCYSYHSKTLVRYTLKGGKQVMVAIFHPGGC